ncbi:hypothetical protein [Hyalangium versicolor]|uniref:hypothetical protein n=1 Tax=Hyalangium versicolor TaxID=2861190 RepID=UPI001CC977B8|nr:hypothetical protein [Hyalangium versicolor]
MSDRGVLSFFDSSTVAANDGLVSSGSASSWGSARVHGREAFRLLWALASLDPW